MRNAKNIISIVGLFILFSIILIGIYFTILMCFQNNNIKKNGIIGIGIIVKIWRGKCGSRYGNSALFKVCINGKDVTYVSDCDVPDRVKIGDKYYIKYLNENPSQNFVMYDSLAK
jgi:hypothetical protein